MFFCGICCLCCYVGKNGLRDAKKILDGKYGGVPAILSVWSYVFEGVESTLEIYDTIKKKTNRLLKGLRNRYRFHS